MRSTVRDVMTDPAVAVSDTAPFKEIVATLAVHRVDALPVIDRDGRVVGMVSEADLLVKEEGPVRTRRRVFHFRRCRLEGRKMRALIAADLMTSPAVTIVPDVSIAAAARVMTERRLRRLPVVDEAGRLLGVVSRSDLLGVFLRSDEDIRDEIVHRVFREVMWIDPSTIPVRVRDGVVTLEGRVERKSMLPLIAELVRAVEGVVGLKLRTTFETDDGPDLHEATGWLLLPYGPGPS
jgi:CBS-domain-containing membrane protein